jgi:hypothetical protein
MYRKQDHCRMVDEIRRSMTQESIATELIKSSELLHLTLDSTISI